MLVLELLNTWLYFKNERRKRWILYSPGGIIKKSEHFADVPGEELIPAGEGDDPTATDNPDDGNLFTLNFPSKASLSQIIKQHDGKGGDLEKSCVILPYVCRKGHLQDKTKAVNRGAGIISKEVTLKISKSEITKVLEKYISKRKTTNLILKELFRPIR